MDLQFHRSTEASLRLSQTLPRFCQSVLSPSADPSAVSQICRSADLQITDSQITDHRSQITDHRSSPSDSQPVRPVTHSIFLLSASVCHFCSTAEHRITEAALCRSQDPSPPSLSLSAPPLQFPLSVTSAVLQYCRSQKQPQTLRSSLSAPPQFPLSASVICSSTDHRSTVLLFHIDPYTSHTHPYVTVIHYTTHYTTYTIHTPLPTPLPTSPITHIHRPT